MLCDRQPGNEFEHNRNRKSQEITVAMIFDDVLHVAAIFIAHTQLLPFAVVLWERAQGRSGAVVLAANHEVFAVVGASALMTQSLCLGRAEAVVGRSEVAAQTPQLVVVVLNAWRVVYADTVCVGGAILAPRWRRTRKWRQKMRKFVDSILNANSQDNQWGKVEKASKLLSEL